MEGAIWRPLADIKEFKVELASNDVISLLDPLKLSRENSLTSVAPQMAILDHLYVISDDNS